MRSSFALVSAQLANQKLILFLILGLQGEGNVFLDLWTVLVVQGGSVPKRDASPQFGRLVLAIAKGWRKPVRLFTVSCFVLFSVF